MKQKKVAKCCERCGETNDDLHTIIINVNEESLKDSTLDLAKYPKRMTVCFDCYNLIMNKN